MDRKHSIIASLLVLAPSVLAVGNAIVVNRCAGDVYYAAVSQDQHAEMKPLPKDGYSEAFRKAGNGVSIKVAPATSGPVAQFEYTFGGDGSVYYDISNIDGNPFADSGTNLSPSAAGAAGFPSCVVVNCPAGQGQCSAAYNLPSDVQTKVCPDTADLVFTVCAGGGGSGGSPAAGAGQSAAAPAASSAAKGGAPAASAAPPAQQATTAQAAATGRRTQHHRAVRHESFHRMA